MLQAGRIVQLMLRVKSIVGWGGRSSAGCSFTMFRASIPKIAMWLINSNSQVSPHSQIMYSSGKAVGTRHG